VSITIHPGCRNTPVGVLKKAIHDLGDRCKGVIVLAIGKDDDKAANFIRISDLTNAEIAYLAAVLNAFIQNEIYDCAEDKS